MVNKFNSLSKSYYASSQILFNHISLDNSLFEPFIFLLRHSVELKIKSLFVEIGESYNKSHSLSKLWENYINIQKNNNLGISFFGESQIKTIGKLLYLYENDYGKGDYFRYPVSSKGITLPTNSFVSHDCDIFPSVSMNKNVLIFDDKVINNQKSINLLLSALRLQNVARILFSQIP